MSDNEQYDPGIRLTVISPKQWHDRPEMFLGPDRDTWWRVIAERFLGEVGAPSRDWTNADLRADGNRIVWTDDSGTPLSPLGLFWREACQTQTVRSKSGSTEVEMVLDSSISASPTVAEVLRLVRRCTARKSGRTVCVEVGGVEATVTSDWREYLSEGAAVRSFWSGMVGHFGFEVATVDSHVHANRAVEVLEQGVPKGTWAELVCLYERSGRADMRIVLHSEAPHRPEDREEGAMAALRQALAVL